MKIYAMYLETKAGKDCYYKVGSRMYLWYHREDAERAAKDFLECYPGATPKEFILVDHDVLKETVEVLDQYISGDLSQYHLETFIATLSSLLH